MKDKIRKLLALALDLGAAPNEAATASRQAAALMTRHEIDLADLPEEEFDLIIASAVGCKSGKKNATEVPTWIGIITWGIRCYTRTRVIVGRGVIFFKGPREDVELAQWLQGILVEGCYNTSKGLSISEANAFRNGYADALRTRLKAMVQDRQDADRDASCTALVKVQEARSKIMDQELKP